jgi:PIN domain nuclease of toxin-antitoxin system
LNDGGELILDTHVWLWLIGGDRALSRLAHQTIILAAQKSLLRLSVFSVWEVALLEAKGRLILPQDCAPWIEASIAHSHVSLVPLSAEIAISSTRLPGSFHGDPADQILVATARALGGTLVTRDAKILRYGRAGHVSVLAA